MEVKEFKLSEYNKNVCRDEFENINDLVHYLKNAPTSKLFKNKKECSSKRKRDPDDDFNDFDTFEDALENLEFGCDKYYSELKDHLKKAKDFIAKREITKKCNFKNDMIGFVPIVPNAIIGNPINMINQDLKQKSVPVIKLILEKAVLNGVKVDDNLQYYSVVFALIEVLERKGIRCEIWEVGASGTDGMEIYTCKIKLKDYLQPINVYKLQFPIISSDMFRRIVFRLKETCKGLHDGDWTWSYGATLISRGVRYYTLENCEPNDGMQEILDISKDDVYIPNVEYLDCRNKDLGYILEQLLTRTNLKKYLTI